MFIRIPDDFTVYYNNPLSLVKEAKVESVQITSMNTKPGYNTDSNNKTNNKVEDGFQDILQTEIKKYR